MSNASVKSIINASIVSAFTIAAALIWKDVITGFIDLFVPPGEELFFKFVAAAIATLLVIVAIYILLKTESKAGSIIKKFGKNRR